MTGSDVHPLDPALWAGITTRANSSREFREGASHLKDVTVELDGGAQSLRLRLDGGGIAVVPREGAAAVTLTLGDWMPLVSGKVSLVQAANPYFGSLRVAGDPLQIAWLVPTLGGLFRLAADVWTRTVAEGAKR